MTDRPPDQPLLEVRDLTVELDTPVGAVEPVRGASLEVGPRETVGLIGRSGSGKTVTALALVGLATDGLHPRLGGSVKFEGSELVGDERATAGVRGGGIGLVLQEHAAALTPVLAVGKQVAETVRAHREVSRGQAWEETLGLLTEVRLDAEAVADAYPHELSGGMQQRVALALALAGRPRLIVADEPTSDLDVTVQAEILELFSSLRRDRGLSLLLISHDLAVVAGMADRIVVMADGRTIDSGPTDHLFASPGHPETARLISAARAAEGF